MIRTHTICLNEASLVAVSALDDIVLHMVRASELRLTPAFLDWMLDDATLMVEQQLGQGFADPGFAATLRRGDHRIALGQWVRHWVCPHIASRFEALAGRLPQFFASSPADLLDVAGLAATDHHRTPPAACPVFNAPSLAA